MKPMNILRPLTLVAALSGLLPALAQTPPAATDGAPGFPPMPELDEGQAGHLEHQLESLAEAIDSLAQRYGELAEQHIGRLERSLSRLPETLDFGFGNLAAPEPPPAPIPPLGTRSSIPVLILQSSETAPEEQAALREDLLVMARVLERATGNSGGSLPPMRAMGVELLSLHSGGQPARTVYLEDYGALFALQVQFPLLPPAVPEAQPTLEPGADESEWEAARRELYGRPAPTGRSMAPNLRLQAMVSPGEAYEEAKVRQLQGDLLRALKQASRIRGLQADDHLLVYVQGAGSNPTGVLDAEELVTRVQPSPPTPGDRGSKATLKATRVVHSVSSTTLMTLRVKKADVDGFAGGILSYDTFRDRAGIQIYAEAVRPTQVWTGF